jgi:hypothetical protein
MSGEKIRIADMKNPVYLPIQEAALKAANANPIVISVETVLEAAKKEAGLSDFGDMSFLTRLQAQVDAVNADANYSNLGRRSTFNDMVRYARNRLQIEDLIKRHPEILDIKLEPNVLIAGLPRSGTTFLHQIMSADPRLRSTPYWEALRPVAAPYIENGVDTRWRLAQEKWEQMDRMTPFVKAIHPFTPDHICEDNELLELDFCAYSIEFQANAPSWRDYQATHDPRPSYRYMTRILKALTFQTGGSHRWVTKCPQHMERLKPLHDVFPDGTFLVNHRDPVASIQSLITAGGLSARLRCKEINLAAIAEYWIDRYERLLRGCVEQRASLDEARTLDVYFHELMGNPTDLIAQAYEKIGLPFDAPAQKHIADALEANKRGKHGQLVYNLREDFGLEPAKIRERFQFYFDRFPKVRVEVI